MSAVPVPRELPVNRYGTHAGTYACVYCWPTWSQAQVWDAQERPCCRACATRAPSACPTPSFVLKDLV